MEEVADNIMSKYSEAPQCVLCELIMTRIEKDLKKHSTQVEIEESIRRVCSRLPKKYATKCNKFVEDYADFVISLISTVPPKELCGEMDLCRANLKKDTTYRKSQLNYSNNEVLMVTLFFLPILRSQVMFWNVVYVIQQLTLYL